MPDFTLAKYHTWEIDDTGSAGDAHQLPIGGEGQRWDIRLEGFAGPVNLMRRNRLGDGTFTPWYPEKPFMDSGAWSASVISARDAQYALASDTANDAGRWIVDPAGNLSGNENLAQWLAGVEQAAKPWGVGVDFAAGEFVLRNNGVFAARVAHTATALGDEPGISGSEAEWLAYWRPIAWDDSLYPLIVQQLLRQHCGRRLIMPAGWVTGTISGTISVNNFSSQNTYFQRIAASTAGVGRLNSYNAATTYPYAIFPGTAQVINWDMPWLLEWTAEVKTGNSGGAVRFLIGKAGGAFAVGDETLTSKGLGVEWLGGAGTEQTCGIIAWDTALRTAATTGTQHNTAGVPIGYQLLWLPGVGAYLFADTVLISSLTETLPSGSGVSGDAGIQTICKNTGANANVVEAGHGYPTLTHLNPLYADMTP